MKATPVSTSLGLPVAPARTVLVVDDHRSFAELLSGALAQAGMTPVGIASSAEEAVEHVLRVRPHVVVMDIQMPRQDGLTATRRIRDLAPDTVIAVVSAHTDPEWVVRAGRAGASAFIPKDGSLTEMLDVLDRCRVGQMLVAPTTFSRPAAAVPPHRSRRELPHLTEREKDVLGCLGRGLPVKSVARALGISLQTCRGYVKSLHVKLDATSQLEVVINAQRLGLLDDPARSDAPDPRSSRLTDVYYTLDGSSPLDGPDTTRPAATRYTGPITVSPVAGAPVVLRYVAVDAAGNSSLVKNETYRLDAPSVPGAPTLGAVVAGDGRATVNWTAPTSPGTSPVTGYAVTAAPATGAAVTATAGPNATQLVLSGLTNGTAYSVSVRATNAVGTGPASPATSVTPARPAVDTVTVTRASWKTGDLRIEGTGSVPGATITIRTGGPGGTVLGTAVVGTPAAGAASGTWSFRLRTAAVTTRPAAVAVTSSGGGVVSPVTLANA